MASNRSHLLSIALTPTSAQVVEAKRAGTGVQIVRRSTLTFAAGAGLEAPTALGTALGEHLKQQGYGTRHAVIGLCPRWVLARHKLVPPADAEAMRGIVNLQIEREFSGSASDLSFDYLLGPIEAEQGQRSLLLAAVRKPVLQQVAQVALSAGLRIQAITPTTFAAGNATQSGTVIVIEDGAAGVMRVQGGAVLGLTACSADPSTLGQASARERLLADLSRCRMQLPGGEVDGQTILIQPTSVDDADARALTQLTAERFGTAEHLQVDSAQLLAEHALEHSDSLIDYNDSRLAVVSRRRLSPRAAWLVRAAVLVLLIGGVVGYLWLDATSRRDELRVEYELIKDDAAELDKMLADTRLAEGWFDKRPPALDVMRELTRTFPTDGQIRVKSLTMQSDMDCQIECTAEDFQTMDRYLRAIERSTQLLQVDPGSVRESSSTSKWVDFPITFRYEPAGKADKQ